MDPLILVGGVVGLGVVVGVSIYPAFKVMPFAYGSARIRAGRSGEITEEELKTYANQSYKDILNQLEKKGYTELLEHIESNFREEYVQRSLRKKSYEHLTRLMKFAPAQYRPFFAALRRQHEYDIVKTVLRSKINPYSTRHVLSALFVDTPNFSVKDLEELESMTLDDFLFKLKRTPYNDIVSDYMEDIKAGNLKNFEKAFYKQSFASLLKASKIDPVLKAYSKMHLDIHNIQQAMTVGEKTFIEGGRLEKVILQRLSEAKSTDDVVRALDGTPFQDVLADVKDPRGLVRALARFRLSFAEKLVMKEPLSIKPFIASMISKEIELRNLRIILKLKHARFEPSSIVEAII